jgi:hypothetical protein
MKEFKKKNIRARMENMPGSYPRRSIIDPFAGKQSCLLLLTSDLFTWWVRYKVLIDQLLGRNYGVRSYRIHSHHSSQRSKEIDQ